MRRILYVSFKKNHSNRLRILWLSLDLKAIRESREVIEDNKNFEEEAES